MSCSPRHGGRARLGATLAALLTLGACADGTAPAEPALRAGAAPARAAAPLAPAVGDTVPGQYIVLLRAGAADVPGLAARLAAEQGGTLRHTYTSALQGFAARLPAQAAEALQRNPNVAAVLPDRVARIVGVQTGLPSWGLDRLDQAALPLDDTYGYPNDGAGVNVYIIDTGVLTGHAEFGGRAAVAYDALGGNGQDCNGHGTHVAGTVGGSTVGVAKGAAIWAIRALDCSGGGNVSDVIAGINWVVRNGRRPAVINMSVATGTDATLNSAVASATNAGVTVVVAAGNYGADACNYSPASAPSAITVGATTGGDGIPSWSNVGSCVDVFAPGESIVSAGIGSTTSLVGMSGTSMASPHGAGAAALVLAANPSATPAQVAQQITSTAAQGILPVPAGTANRLLQTGQLGALLPTVSPSPTPAPAPAPSGPTASFTASCPGQRATCSFDGSASTGAASYTWSFGNGVTRSTSTAKTSYTYATVGTFTVTLTVTDAQGRTASASQSVRVRR